MKEAGRHDRGGASWRRRRVRTGAPPCTSTVLQHPPSLKECGNNEKWIGLARVCVCVCVCGNALSSLVGFAFQAW